MFERRLFFHVDWLLLGAVLLIAAVGAAMIYSTTYVRLPDGTGHAGREFWTQLYALSLGCIALLVCLTIDYRLLAEHSLFLFAGLMGLPRRVYETNYGGSPVAHSWEGLTNISAIGGLVLVIIVAVAFLTDKLWAAVGRFLFPHRAGKR